MFADNKVNWNEVDSDVEYDPEWEDENEKKWMLLRKPVIPDVTFETVDYMPAPGKRLAEKFARSGLQVIVKIASIELTPEKPDFPVGGWHVSSSINRTPRRMGFPLTYNLD
jgi:hypothetical protein